jgi:hypothetical protein
MLFTGWRPFVGGCAVFISVAVARPAISPRGTGPASPRSC